MLAIYPTNKQINFWSINHRGETTEVAKQLALHNETFHSLHHIVEKVNVVTESRTILVRYKTIYAGLIQL